MSETGETFTIDEAVEYLRRHVRETVDPYWGIETYPMFPHPEINRGFFLDGYDDETFRFLVECDGPLGGMIEALVAASAERARFFSVDTVVLRRGNLALIHIGFGPRPGRGIGSKDLRILEIFNGMNRGDLARLRGLDAERLAKMQEIWRGIDDLLKPYEDVMRHLEEYPYPPFGSEDYYGYIGNVREGMMMLGALQHELEEANRKFAMPHHIPELTGQHRWNRVVELAPYTTGERYGGIRAFEEMYRLSVENNFDTPPLKIIAEFLSSLDPREMPEVDEMELAVVMEAARDTRTTAIRRVRIYKEIAVADRHVSGGGARIFLLRDNGKWVAKGGLFYWMH